MRINPIPVQTERLRGEWRMWLMTDGATRRAATETLRLPQQPASSCTGRSHPAGCSPAGTASTGRAWRTASGWDRSICLLTVQMFVCGIYYKDDTEGDARVCASEGTHSIEDLKFLLGLEDVDLQRKKTNMCFIPLFIFGLFCSFQYMMSKTITQDT